MQDAHLLLNKSTLLYYFGIIEPWVMAQFE